MRVQLLSNQEHSVKALAHLEALDRARINFLNPCFQGQWATIEDREIKREQDKMNLQSGAILENGVYKFKVKSSYLDLFSAHVTPQSCCESAQGHLASELQQLESYYI
jgi:hypothetical protein